jgi:hypothetical protein
LKYSNIVNTNSIKDNQNENDYDKANDDYTAFFSGSFFHSYFGYVNLFLSLLNWLIGEFDLILDDLDFISLLLNENPDDLKKVKTLFNRILKLKDFISLLNDVIESILDSNRFSLELLPSELLGLFFVSFLFYKLIHFQINVHFLLHKMNNFISEIKVLGILGRGLVAYGLELVFELLPVSFVADLLLSEFSVYSVLLFLCCCSAIFSNQEPEFPRPGF